MIYRIVTGSREQIRKQISILGKQGMEREKDYDVLSALHFPDPSPEVGDLPGTDMEVWEVIFDRNPIKAKLTLFDALEKLFDTGLLLIWCEGGWHRSVAFAEFIKRRMSRSGHTVEIEHLGVSQ